MRLDKFLAQNGFGTRSEVKELIKKGKITINQNIVKSPDLKVNENDSVMVEGIPVKNTGTVYYMLNKPSGVVSATRDNTDKTVIELLEEKGIVTKDLFPVGRLDKDTEGLLILTQDGILAHNLLSPKKHVSKTYFVKCLNVFTEEMKNNLTTGVDIGDEKKTLPAEINILNPHEIELTICEGRFHQVKRMLHAVNNEVTYLKRISMGNVLLDENLAPGEFRMLTESEIETLKNNNRKS